MAQHNFGIVVFRSIDKDMWMGQRFKATIDEPFDPEDPFCLSCGQKLINVKPDEECPGRTKGHFLNNPRQLITPEEIGAAETSNR